MTNDDLHLEKHLKPLAVLSHSENEFAIYFRDRWSYEKVVRYMAKKDYQIFKADHKDKLHPTVIKLT